MTTIPIWLGLILVVICPVAAFSLVLFLAFRVFMPILEWAGDRGWL